MVQCSASDSRIRMDFSRAIRPYIIDGRARQAYIGGVSSPPCPAFNPLGAGLFFRNQPRGAALLIQSARREKSNTEGEHTEESRAHSPANLPGVVQQEQPE